MDHCEVMKLRVVEMGVNMGVGRSDRIRIREVLVWVE